ncbi:sulfate/molybdate ABC transporter ATP-binding protein [[Clostridium] dakarense]|uniref:sulfate/molybdate ABC transporter ATP-binding protein n=1 Tax=Faecalimicrobium dakarense TaxID=1301100 RepID=UPI0004AD3377|nr:ATP-binding cassette domain-containing protein [[Clostridium] dakarense]
MSFYIDIEKKLESFNLKVKFEQEGNVLGFLGESGCGKSMTLKCIAGIETPTNGKIILNNRILFDSEKKINLSVQERKIGFLFQNYALFPHMTVRENIEIGLFNLEKSKVKDISNKYIKQFKLEGLENRYPHQLSGGQSQRVALARVLATEPQILLLDEPFSALDYHLRSDMEIELVNILNEYNGEVIFVTHDIKEAYRVCDDIVVYDKGISKDKKSIEELFKNPNSIVEAKMTGCKNILKIEKTKGNNFYAKDLSFLINTNKILNDNTNYIGIRQEHINLKKDIKGLFEIKNIVKNPFGYTIFIKNKENRECKFIQVDLYKDSIEFNINDSLNLDINEDKIMYLK